MAADFTVRQCSSGEDLRRMHYLVAHAWSVLGPRCSMHVGDLYWRFCRSGDHCAQELFPMWFDSAGQLVGFLQYDPPTSCDMTVHPDCIGAAVEDAMLEWAEQRCLRELAARQTTGGLTVGCFDGNQLRRQLLERRGYEPREGGAIHLFRDLSAPVPPRPVPQGYIVRPLLGLEEFLRTLETGRELHGRKRLDLERYRRMMATDGFSPGQDVVALDARGQLVAACIWWYDASNRVGELEPVGCHSDHRRKGLASAVLAEAEARLRAKGATSVVVYTSSQNLPAISSYESCGFTVIGMDRDFTKPLVRP